MPDELEDRVRDEIISAASKRTHRRIEVFLDSEIYYDLNIYGEELYEFLDDLCQDFEIDLRGIDVSEIAPGEGFEPTTWLLTKLGRRPFKSFKVSDIIQIALKRRQEN